MIKYKYIWAWDTLWQASAWYKQQQQAFAEQTKAPLDATFQAESGTWHTFQDIVNPETKRNVKELVEWLEEDEELL